jgi:hypothetical protein
MTSRQKRDAHTQTVAAAVTSSSAASNEVVCERAAKYCTHRSRNWLVCADVMSRFAPFGNEVLFELIVAILAGVTYVLALVVGKLLLCFVCIVIELTRDIL